MAKLMPIATFVEGLKAAQARHDGYIMGATGENPRKWPVNSSMFTQYKKAKQHAKALYWREHAERVWDCNGLAEGLYRDYSGVSINTQARYNYAQWCKPKGEGMIPVKYRVAGAAVFWGSSAPNIHHVAYLIRPVSEGKPEGDWWIIEARGVMYGVVMTKLYERAPNFWGWMTKYFDYANATENAPEPLESPARDLRNGCEGEDVKALQVNLIRLGYSCGKWGADGDFGDATEMAVRAFQRDHGLQIDGIAGRKSIAALDAAIAALEKPEGDKGYVLIRGGSCYVRSEPSTLGQILGVAHEGSKFPFDGETSESGWKKIVFGSLVGWVSGKYGVLQ